MPVWTFYVSCLFLPAVPMRPESKGGGRPIDSIWNCYRKVETPSGIHCVCLGCSANKAGIVKRMKEHAGACKPLLRKITTEEVYYPPLMPAPSTPSTCQSQQSCGAVPRGCAGIRCCPLAPSKAHSAPVAPESDCHARFRASRVDPAVCSLGVCILSAFPCRGARPTSEVVGFAVSWASALR